MDCRQFPVLPAARDLSGWRDLFFDVRASATGESHAVSRSAHETLVEFIATDANSLLVQPCDFGYRLDSAVPSPLGFAPGDPTSLLLIQTAEYQIEIPMVLRLGMIACLTSRTRTLPNRKFRFHHWPPSLVGPEDYQIRSNRGIAIGQVLSTTALHVLRKSLLQKNLQRVWLSGLN
jgi:hypothetical protein